MWNYMYGILVELYTKWFFGPDDYVERAVVRKQLACDTIPINYCCRK